MVNPNGTIMWLLDRLGWSARAAALALDGPPVRPRPVLRLVRPSAPPHLESLEERRASFAREDARRRRLAIEHEARRDATIARVLAGGTAYRW